MRFTLTKCNTAITLLYGVDNGRSPRILVVYIREPGETILVTHLVHLLLDPLDLPQSNVMHFLGGEIDGRVPPQTRLVVVLVDTVAAPGARDVRLGDKDYMKRVSE